MVEQSDTAKPNWIPSAVDSPSRSTHYLCWDDKIKIMWIGAFNDSGGHDTWGDARPLGWVTGCVPTHWAECPEAP